MVYMLNKYSLNNSAINNSEMTISAAIKRLIQHEWNPKKSFKTNMGIVFHSHLILNFTHLCKRIWHVEPFNLNVNSM